MIKRFSLEESSAKDRVSISHEKLTLCVPTYVKILPRPMMMLDLEFPNIKKILSYTHYYGETVMSE